MKRVLSSVLALFMLVTLFPTGTITSVALNSIDINHCLITLSESEYTYNGEVFVPKVSVTYGEETVLTENTDYTLSYQNRQSVDAGEYDITVSGIGEYGSETVVSYIIVPQQMDTIKEEFSLSQTAYTYDGAEHKPEVLFNGQSPGEEFKVQYDEDVIGIGEKTVTVTAAENTNYTGSIQLSYSIAYMALEDIRDSFTLSQTVFDYDGAEHKPEVLFNGQALGEEFTAEFPEDAVNAGEKSVIITAGENTNYSGSIQLVYTVNPIDITALWSVTAEQREFVFTGAEHTPAISVTNGEEAVDAEIYRVEYVDNVNAGTATVRVTAQGNYTGSVSTQFDIIPKAISYDWAEEIEETGYTGEEIEPEVCLTDPDRQTVLIAGEDYTVSYRDNVDAGEAVATVTATGNYSGEIELPFRISKSTLVREDVVLSSTELVYTGAELKPIIRVTKNEIALVENQDYTLSYSGDTLHVGTVIVTVTAQGNYSGTVTAEYAIIPKTIDLSWVEEVADEVYTGEEITPVLTVKDGEYVLVSGTDYDVVYADNINAGTATAEITAKGDYTGKIAVEFSVNPAEIDDMTLVGSYVYTGSAIAPELVVKSGDLILGTADYSVQLENNIHAGMATVTVTAVGNFKGELTKDFEIAKKSIEELDITLTQYSFTYDQKPHCPLVNEIQYGEVVLEKDVDYTVDADPNTMNVGTYDIVVTAKSDDYTGSVTLSYTINVASLKNLRNLFTLMDGTEVVTDSTYTYDGKEHRPSILFNGVDISNFQCFRVEYNQDENYYKSAGTKSITVYGYSPYSESIDLTFEINPLDLHEYVDQNSAEIVYSYNGESLQQGIVYNSHAIEPTAEIEGLHRDTDFVLIYSDNVDAGTAKIIVSGIGNYSGEISKEFTINPYVITQDNTAIYTGDNVFKYTGYAQKVSILGIISGDLTLTEKDYTVTYENNVAVSTDDNKAKMIVFGTGNFSGSVVYEFTIQKISFTEIQADLIKLGTLKSYIYDGKAKTPTVTIGGKDANGVAYKLTQGTDYTVNYWNNVNAGVAQVLIRGTGNCSGMYILSFVIRPQQIKADDIVIDKASCVYTGSKITPKVTVTVNKKKLVLNSHYTLSCIRNVNVGTATVAVVGKGNYEGVVLADFEITKRTLSKSMFSVASSVAYTGKALLPRVTAKYCKPTDYTLSYSDNIRYGTATITVKGKNNCTGTVKLTFNIVPKKVSGVKAVSTSYNSVQLSWSRLSGVTGYAVYRSTDNKTWMRIATVKGASNTRYKNTGLTAGTTYYYRVRAYKTANGSNYYGALCSTVSVKPIPGKVANLDAVSVSARRVQLSWSKLSGVTGYAVYRSADNKTWTRIATVKGASKTAYTNTGLTKNRTYYYRVRAYKTANGANHYGAYSSVQSVKIIR